MRARELFLVIDRVILFKPRKYDALYEVFLTEEIQDNARNDRHC